MARFQSLAIVLSVGLVGCLDRTRVNAQCEWTAERVRSLDVSGDAQRRHLYGDVALAEELAIRYADAVHKERYGFDGHGGLIENGRLRDRCMAALIGTIAVTHGLTVQDVERARAVGYRDARWDFGVLLSFACVYGCVAWTIVRALSRRFPPEDGWPALVAPLLASLPAAVAALQLFVLWGGALEAIRIGNGHVSSYRTARSPWPGHGVALWMGGAGVFLLIAGLHYWRQRRVTASFMR